MPSIFPRPLGHWSTLIEGLQASPQECYTAIEEAIRRREIPDVRVSRVTFKEGGFLSAERIYLRVSRKGLGFDICAAPFGTGFFFSWRFGKLPPSNFFGCFGLLLVGCVVGYILFLLNEPRRTAEAPLGLLETLVLDLLLFLIPWVVGRAIRKGYLSSEHAILNMPLIGSLFDRLFRPSTYYKLDTIDIFQKAVHAAVLEVVDDAMRMRGKGLRALAPASPPAGKAMTLACLRSSSPGVPRPSWSTTVLSWKTSSIASRIVGKGRPGRCSLISSSTASPSTRPLPRTTTVPSGPSTPPP